MVSRLQKMWRSIKLSLPKACVYLLKHWRLALSVIVSIIALYLIGWAAYLRWGPPHRDWSAWASVPGPGGKTWWDWLELLVIPVVLALGAWWLQRSERDSDRKIAKERFELEQKLTDQRIENEQKLAAQRRQDDQDKAKDQQQETALKNFINKMTELLLDKDHPLRKSQPEDEVRVVARTRILATLRGLDSARKGMLLKFLYEAELIGIGKLKNAGDGLKESGGVSPPIIILNGADLNGADLSGTDLIGVNLSETNLRGADLSCISLYEADLNYIDLSGAKIDDSSLSEANLSGANLNGANLCRTDLSGAALDHANLSEVNLGGADLHRANLLNAYLVKANLSRANLSATNLGDANLSMADLSGANLSGAFLIKADLSGSNLSGANLSGAFLIKADLSGSNLSGANLRGANLSEANLSEADLSGAKLNKDYLSGLQLVRSLLNETHNSGHQTEDTIMPDGKKYDPAIHIIDEHGHYVNNPPADPQPSH